MIGDLSVHGLQGTLKRYLTTSGTKVMAGEPTHSTATLSSGVPNSTVYVLVAADTPVVGTYKFGGVAVKTSLVVSAGTTKAQYLPCACPVPWIGFIRGNATTAASVDTTAEIVALLQYPALIAYNATGGADGGEGYTISCATTGADTSGCEIIGGNAALYTLDIVVDGRAYRNDIS